jgi:ADP-heptose:LPS heptosyltransferase
VIAAVSRRRRARGSGGLLLMRWGGVGDVVLTLPAMRLIRRACQGDTIAVMGYGEAACLADSAEYADEVLQLDPDIFSPDASEHEAARRRMLRVLRRFDRIVNYHPYPAIVELLRACGVPTVHHDDEIFDRIERHAVEHFLDPLRALEIAPDWSPPQILLRPEEKRSAATILRHLDLRRGDAIVAVHAGSGDPRKRWPAERYGEVIRWLAGRGVAVLLLSGPADEALVEELHRGISLPRVHRIGGLPLRRMAAVIARSTIYLGNDSGLMHVAAAVGVPVVAVFGPSDPLTWGPIGASNTVLHGSAGCPSCTRQELDTCPRQRCLETIQTSLVIDVLEKKLASP